MLRPFGLVSALLALVLALPSTALAQSTDRSVVFTSDPSQAMVMDRATGLRPLIEAASGVLPLAEDGLAVARERLRGVAQLLAQARQRQAEAAAALVRANRLVADTVQEADRLRNTYDDALAGLSDSSRRKLQRDAHTRSNRSAVVRLTTSSNLQPTSVGLVVDERRRGTPRRCASACRRSSRRSHQHHGRWGLLADCSTARAGRGSR